MTTPLELQIRSRIASMLAGKLTIREFYRWFVPASLDNARFESPEAERLVNTVVHLFAELSSEILTPREFRHELDLIASKYIAAGSPWNHPLKPTVTVTTSAENDLTEEDAPVRFVPAAPVAAPA